MLERSDGKLQFVMRNGSLPHMKSGLSGGLCRFAGSPESCV